MKLKANSRLLGCWFSSRRNELFLSLGITWMLPGGKSTPFFVANWALFRAPNFPFLQYKTKQKWKNLMCEPLCVKHSLSSTICLVIWKCPLMYQSSLTLRKAQWPKKAIFFSIPFYWFNEYFWILLQRNKLCHFKKPFLNYYKISKLTPSSWRYFYLL